MGACRRIVVKKGDDMRIDAAISFTFKAINKIWKRCNNHYYGIPVHVVGYDVVAMGDRVGACEYVPGLVSLREFKSSHLFGGRSAREVEKMRRQLIATAVGGYVATYVLGVNDRHFDNIQVRTSDGSLIQIDFGFVFGEAPMLDAGELPMSVDLKAAMGDDWDKFCELVLRSFEILQGNEYRVPLIDLVTRVMSFNPALATKAHDFMSDVLLNGNVEEGRRKLVSHLDHATSNFWTLAKEAVREFKYRTNNM
eukprot:c16631_g1_i2.p1 GENE.c16631_g1_i2~~c16631_g1_i2.p1  ORF type:complete len:252 (+),score=65.95 c16631_g1_i2:818-1573(+)